MRFVEIGGRRFSIDTPELETIARVAVANSGLGAAQVYETAERVGFVAVQIDDCNMYLVPSMRELAEAKTLVEAKIREYVIEEESRKSK